MDISQRISALRKEMKHAGVDFYLIPTADYHQSEYVGDYFKFREYMTGFTGSAGTALFMPDRAILWTDGRYFIQAEEELEGSGIELFRSGEPNVDTIEEFLKKEMKSGMTLGFDGRTIGYSDGENYKKIAEERNGSISSDYDFASLVWENRPALSTEPACR